MLEDSHGTEEMEQWFRDSSQLAESFLPSNALNLGLLQEDWEKRSDL